MEQFLVTWLWAGYVAWFGWEKETLHIGLKPALVFLAKLVQFSLALFFTISARSNIYTFICFASKSVLMSHKNCCVKMTFYISITENIDVKIYKQTFLIAEINSSRNVSVISLLCQPVVLAMSATIITPLLTTKYVRVQFAISK